MAYLLTDRSKQLLNKTNIEPNLVLCIDGYPKCFGAQITQVYAYIGMPDLYIDGSWTIGGLAVESKILDYISLDGTTTNITQQLDLDKSAATSTQTVKIRLVDFNNEITNMISPSFGLEDVLYRDAQLYLGFKDGSFPEDYSDLFIGKINAVDTGSGFVELTIAHPDELKRSEIYPKIETSLVADTDYYSKTIQDLKYYQSGSFNGGVVQIRYLNSPFIGDVANISVSGTLITVSIEAGVTKAKTIKEAIRDNVDTVNMVSVLVSGNPNATQTAQATTDLEVSTEVEVSNVEGFYLPQSPIFRTYIRVNDEIIEYTGIDTVNNKFTGCTRKSLNSTGQFHKIDDSVSSFYKLGDDTSASNAIDLSLQLMLSDGIGGDYIDGLSDLKFYNFGTVDNYPNAFMITGIDAIRQYNIQVGDTCTITGSAIVGNNITAQTVEDIEKTDLGTIVYISGALFTAEAASVAVASFKSQYNTLPDGCGYSPRMVDINRFKELQRRYPSFIANYEIYLKDTINPKDFINAEIMIPSALYAIPRQGKSSIGISAPPLYEGGTKTLDENTLKNINKLKTSRSINKYFYNAIVFKYNADSIEDRTLSGDIIYSADSQNRINAPTKAYTIKANGLRPSPVNSQLITRNSKRLLQRYQYGAEAIPVEPDFKTGYTIEVGDAVVFGSPELQVSDSLSGNRDYKPRVFEVVNKDFDWKKGSIRLQIVDTNYSAGIRYGVWSPASYIDTGSSTTQVHLTDSFGSESEKDKWIQYVGKTVRIRSQDYSLSANVKLISFDADNDYIINVSTIPFTPTSGMILDVPNYDSLNLNADSFYKALHPFWNTQVEVTSGVSGTQFNVSAPDAAKLFVNASIRIRSDDYSVDSYDKVIKIESIAGTLVTCNDIGFTPVAGYKVDLIGFVSDKGYPYAWV